jgi:hypothetical protein
MRVGIGIYVAALAPARYRESLNETAWLGIARYRA